VRAATSKADLRQQQHWLLKKCLQGGRAHPLAGLWGGDALLLSPRDAAGNRNPSPNAKAGVRARGGYIG
jgi:hypothetical protein